MKKSKLILISVAQALAVFAYIFLVAQIMTTMEHVSAKINTFWQPVAILFLFVLSAAITGLLVLGKSVTLYLDNFKKEAVELFGFTIAWMAVIAAIIFVILANLR